MISTSTNKTISQIIPVRERVRGRRVITMTSRAANLEPPAP